MKKRGFKSFVAMLAMISMLLESTATVFAVDGSADYQDGQAIETGYSSDEVTSAPENNSEAVPDPGTTPEVENLSVDTNEAAQTPEITPENKKLVIPHNWIIGSNKTSVAIINN